MPEQSNETSRKAPRNKKDFYISRDSHIYPGRFHQVSLEMVRVRVYRMVRTLLPISEAPRGETFHGAASLVQQYSYWVNCGMGAYSRCI